MAHFAKISEQNKVLQVVTLNNSDMLNADGVEDEAVGQQYLEKHNKWPAQMWIQTSYHTTYNQHRNGGIPFRGNYAGIGYTWDADNQIFWHEKPYIILENEEILVYDSWVKNIKEARWQSPIGDKPVLTQEQKDQNIANTHRWRYIWDEANITWNLTDLLK